MKRPARLTDRFCETVGRPGFYGDGGRGGYGLQFRVHRTRTGILTRTWVQKIRVHGKPTALGLGRYPIVALDEARLGALQNAVKVHRGIDPRTAAVAAPVAVSGVPVAAPAPTGPTFAEVAADYIAMVGKNWKAGGGSRRKWTGTVKAVAFRNKPATAITREDVRAEVVPIWGKKPTLARTRLVHIRRILDFADVDPNPADGLRAKLPRRNGKTTHYKALPHAEVPGAIRTIRAHAKRPRSRADTSWALEFAILTASRPKEALTARWEHIEGDIWTLPAKLYKTGREHRVPLSSGALALLAKARKRAGGTGLVFRSAKGGPISRSSLRKLLKFQGVKGTVHGFRASFRNWCAETGVDRQVAEAALGHVVGGTEGAYLRSDLLERRRPVMERWATAANRREPGLDTLHRRD